MHWQHLISCINSQGIDYSSFLFIYRKTYNLFEVSSNVYMNKLKILRIQFNCYILFKIIAMKMCMLCLKVRRIAASLKETACGTDSNSSTLLTAQEHTVHWRSPGNGRCEIMELDCRWPSHQNWVNGTTGNPPATNIFTTEWPRNALLLLQGIARFRENCLI